MSKIAAVFLPGVRRMERSVEPRAEAWDRRNDEALTADGPMWVVLGDSTSQGIGSSVIETSYVDIVRTRLDEHTGRSWRVLNLSFTGARMDDVVHRQLPALRHLDLEADLVTCLVGANDVFARTGSMKLASATGRLLEALPHGTVVAEIGSGGASAQRVAMARSLFEESAQAGHIVLFDAWRWPTREGMWSQDRFHPNDWGYAAIADQVWDAVLPVLSED